jgi:hypothetical protein
MTDADVWRQRFKRYPRVVLATMLAQLTITPGGEALPAMLDELNEVWRGLQAQGAQCCPNHDAPEYGAEKEAHGANRKAIPETAS